MTSAKCRGCGAELTPADKFCGRCGAPGGPPPNPKPAAAPPAAPAASTPAPSKPGLIWWPTATIVLLLANLLATNALAHPNDLAVYSVFVLGPALVALAAVRPLPALNAAGVAAFHELCVLVALFLKYRHVDEEYFVGQFVTALIAAALAAAAAAISRRVRARSG